MFLNGRQHHSNGEQNAGASVAQSCSIFISSFWQQELFEKLCNGWTTAVRIFPNPTEAIRGKETEASDWSNYDFDEPPPFTI